jgi:hypothetical protein
MEAHACFPVTALCTKSRAFHVTYAVDCKVMKLPDLDELRPAGGLGHHIIGTSVSYHAEDILGFEKVLLRNNSQFMHPTIFPASHGSTHIISPPRRRIRKGSTVSLANLTLSDFLPAGFQKNGTWTPVLPYRDLSMRSWWVPWFSEDVYFLYKSRDIEENIQQRFIMSTQRNSRCRHYQSGRCDKVRESALSAAELISQLILSRSAYYLVSYKDVSPSIIN